MLIRCNVTPELGFNDLYYCKLFADFFKADGRLISYAVNKEGYEMARRFLGEKEKVFRMPSSCDNELERLANLQKKEQHQVIVINLRQIGSAYLFQVKKRFQVSVYVDHGGSFFIYADFIIDAALNASAKSHHCIGQARLLLGPKFHICEPKPSLFSDPAMQISRVLISVRSKSELFTQLLMAFSALSVCPEIHILVDEGYDLGETLLTFQDMGMPIKAFVKPVFGLFHYHEYAFIITEAGQHCLDFAHWGLFFMTLAWERSQLDLAYRMEHVGLSPTFGWFPTMSIPSVLSLLEKSLKEVHLRASCRRVGRELVDGLALQRIASLMPDEPVRTRAK